MRSLSGNFLSANLLIMQMSCDLIVQMSLAASFTTAHVLTTICQQEVVRRLGPCRRWDVVHRAGESLAHPAVLPD